MVEEFRKYVEQFDLNDKAILRKYYHSLRVKDLCSVISGSLNMSSEDIALSKIIGLLHDYSCFQNTDNKVEDIDYADLSVERLFINNEILKFWPNIKDYDEIFDAIKYHNKTEVPLTLSDHNAQLCKVLRDACKLDIIYIWSSGINDIKESNHKISDLIKDEFDKETMIDSTVVKNDNEHIVQILSLVFDLNFKYSFKYLKNYDLINKLYDRLDNKDKYKYYFDEINKYIERMI